MSTLIGYGLRFGFVVAIAVIFTIFVIYRPGASGQLPSRPRLAGLLVAGALIGVIFLATHSLYAPTPVV